MLKVVLSLLISMLIMQASFASRLDIESHLNTHNSSGIQHSGDRDFDGDGEVESDGHEIFKTVQSFNLIILPPVVISLIPILIPLRPIVYTFSPLTQQDDPNLVFRPPIAA